jgi:hypothetical protein
VDGAYATSMPASAGFAGADGVNVSETRSTSQPSYEPAPPMSAPMEISNDSDDVLQFAGAPTSSIPPPPPPPPPPSLPPGDSAPPEDASKPTLTRIIIYTGSLVLTVSDAELATEALIARVEKLGGHLQTRNNTDVTVRVPVAMFKALVDELKKSGQVTYENIQSQDVTKAVVDLELRKDTAVKSHKRLQELLRSAANVADILAIENELRRLTTEIESMKGELSRLYDLASMSTLTVSFRADAPGPRPFPQRRASRFPWVNAVGVEQVMNGF